MMKQIMIYLFISVSLLATAQKQKNIWYFGNKAGIDFNTGIASPLSNGQMQSSEGCASISDTAGNLLFYTNGGPFSILSYQGGVWNKNHVLMPSGNLDSVSACNSSAQTALIVPDPKNQNRYYIFTTDCQENSMAGGLRYDMVDITLDSGRGDVIKKNVPVVQNVTESVIGIKHTNGNDYWIIVAEINNNKYHSILVSKNGVNDSIITSIGNSKYQSAGQLCTSPNGKLIGFATTFDTYLFDFDQATGTLSNFISLGVPSFGCAFSPDNNVFYGGELSTTSGAVHQFDLNAANIPSSIIIVGYTAWLGNMQLAPDGKIYMAKRNSSNLPVINNPNSLGNGCNYVASGLNLAGKTSNMGLPNFVNQYIDNWCDSYDTINIISSLAYNSPSGNYTWNLTGTYQDSIINTKGCDSIITINLTINSNSIFENIDDDNITLFPNPTERDFKIDLGKIYRKVLITTINANGKTVKKLEIEQIQLVNILIEEEPSGIYLIKIDIGDKYKTYKIIKK